MAAGVTKKKVGEEGEAVYQFDDAAKEAEEEEKEEEEEEEEEGGVKNQYEAGTHCVRLFLG